MQFCSFCVDNVIMYFVIYVLIETFKTSINYYLLSIGKKHILFKRMETLTILLKGVLKNALE